MSWSMNLGFSPVLDLFCSLPLPCQTLWTCTRSRASSWASAWASSASWPACVLACAAAPTGGWEDQSDHREEQLPEGLQGRESGESGRDLL